MKKNVVKMRVCIGFDCNPSLEAISYEDEVSSDGKVYQTTRGARNEKTLVDFNQVWIKFDNFSKTPYWDAYAIVDAETATDETYAEVGRKLYDSAINAVREAASDFSSRSMKMNIPEGIASIVKGRLNPVAPDGKVSIKVEDFKGTVYDLVRSSGNDLAAKYGFSSEAWDGFFVKTLTPEILGTLMKGLPVLRINGDAIIFQSNELYKQAVAAVSGKVTSDVFARFMEASSDRRN